MHVVHEQYLYHLVVELFFKYVTFYNVILNVSLCIQIWYLFLETKAKSIQLGFSYLH